MRVVRKSKHDSELRTAFNINCDRCHTVDLGHRRSTAKALPDVLSLISCPLAAPSGIEVGSVMSTIVPNPARILSLAAAK